MASVGSTVPVCSRYQGKCSRADLQCAQLCEVDGELVSSRMKGLKAGADEFIFINFLLGTAFPTSHRFWCIVFPFSF